MTLEEARGYLARAVLTQGPTFVYNLDIPENDELSCSYFPQEDAPEGNPTRITACLVGVAMRIAGRSVERWMEDNTCDTASLVHAWNLSDPAARYFRQAQVSQDVGESWGDAYEAAERYAASFLRRGY